MPSPARLHAAAGAVALMAALLNAPQVTAQAGASNAPPGAVVVTIDVISPTEPADRFVIVDAVLRPAVLVRTGSPFGGDPQSQPEVRLVNGEGTVLSSQPFGWSRVMTVPPAAPGQPADDLPSEVPIERPQVSLLIPIVEGATRVEVYLPATGTVAAWRDIRVAPDAASVGAADPATAPPPAMPGTFNVLLLGSGFTPERRGLLPSIANSVRQQFLMTEPFRSSAARIAFHTAVAPDLGCAPGCGGLDRLMCCSAQSIINAASASGFPFDEILVVHDTPIYAGSGGIDLGTYRANSYASYATAYNGPWTAPMLVHEFGHSFGNLCDEYSQTTGGVVRPCANCRSSCSELAPFGPTCVQGCDVGPAFFRPEPSIMLDLSIPTYNNASIHTTGPVDGLATRLNYFLGVLPTAVPSAPTSLQSQVNGNQVTLSWAGGGTSTPGASYQLQVGSAVSQSNLFNGLVGTVTTASGTVGAGQYFWRVLALNAVGTSAPSAEGQFVVGGAAPCTGPPGPVQNLSATVAGSVVTLNWAAAAGQVVTYVVEAGSAAGLVNLYNAATNSASVSLQTAAPSGIYFVRIRGQNGCGTSPPSNEVIVVVP